MNKITRILFFSLLLSGVTGCDTVEDSFSVGGKPKENEILSVDQSQLVFVPDGGSYEIQITSIATWTVSVDNNNEGQFSVSPTSGKGNGVVTVTCKPNSTQNSYNAEVLVSPGNFDMESVRVSLRQANAVFSIERSPSAEPVPEEGGSVTMTAYSSLNWQLAPVAHDADGNVGDPEWLVITPGLSGEGVNDGSPIEYRFTWTPNYTDKERMIRFVFKPTADLNLDNSSHTITLSQQAGTLPQGVRCFVDNLDVVNADISLEYSSRSPIKDCGLRLYRISDGTETLVNTYRPAGDEFALNGNYMISIMDLDENSRFRIEPYVENEVGASGGDSREIATGIKPENMVYQGVSIENSSGGGVAVEAGLTSAVISLIVTSDVVPLEPDGIESATVMIDGKTTSGVQERLDEGKWRYIFSISDLQPNKEYEYQVNVKGKDLPSNLGKVVNNTATVSGKLKTQGQTPGDDDNSKPSVGD